MKYGCSKRLVSYRYGCIIVLTPEALIACDISGVRWKVENHLQLQCCFELSVIGSRVVIEYDHGPGYAYEYDIHTGCLLDFRYRLFLLFFFYFFTDQFIIGNNLYYSDSCPLNNE